MTKQQLAILRGFGPQTYAMEISKSPARDELENLGYIEWVPPMFGTRMWAITSKGVLALAAQGATT